MLLNSRPASHHRPAAGAKHADRHGLCACCLTSLLNWIHDGRWSAHPENLFLVEPYVYFPGQRVAARSLLDSERCARSRTLRSHRALGSQVGLSPGCCAVQKPLYTPTLQHCRRPPATACRLGDQGSRATTPSSPEPRCLQGRGGGARHAAHRVRHTAARA